MPRLVKFRGRRELTYAKDWMVGGPYTWKPGESVPVENADAEVLLKNTPTDFVDQGECEAPKPAAPQVKKPKERGVVNLPGDLTCVLCGKICKSSSGLAAHMRSCKGDDS